MFANIVDVCGVTPMMRRGRRGGAQNIGGQRRVGVVEGVACNRSNALLAVGIKGVRGGFHKKCRARGVRSRERPGVHKSWLTTDKLSASRSALRRERCGRCE